jgi:hypothetical protein
MRDDRPVAVVLVHGDRRFQVMAYHDAIRHDGPALELAELVDGELGPPLVTVLFAHDGSSSECEALLTTSGLPLNIPAAFMEEVVKEQRHLQANPFGARRDDVR